MADKMISEKIQQTEQKKKQKQKQKLAALEEG